jgi:hypothetical protein
MPVNEILTLFAIFVSPIIAVVVTRFMDDRSEKKRRQHQIFRDLMRTRAAKISQEHVTALNLIEIEFHDCDKVRAAWQKYMENLSSELPIDVNSQSSFLVRRDQLFIKLMQEVANQIGFKKVDITDLMTSNYYPRGWANEEDEQRQLRQLLIQVLSGSRMLPVKVTDPSQWNGPFPPFSQVNSSKNGSLVSENQLPIALPKSPPEDRQKEK